ncbi:MAG: HlyC/CorC family transporter [Lachnospiraceae bacterium]|nr:HlyC/CorC family transporter [Lachnospiraceae bacterium]
MASDDMAGDAKRRVPILIIRRKYMDDGGSSNTGILKKLMQKLPFVDTEDVTEEEIISMVNEGHEQGVLLENEAEMIHNIFEFGDKEAKDIMTHRKNIAALDGNRTFEEAIGFMIEKRYSRFPVYLESIDNIIGVLHIKEALFNSQKQELMKTPIREIEGLVHEVSFIPETRNINALFQEMQSAKSHMVIVVDEYGQTAGLVAMEDILEEIVGNIFDEHDEEDRFIEKKEDGTFLMNGMTPLEEVEEVLELDLEEADFDTLNGLLISLIGHIPAEGEQVDVEYKSYRFEVLAVEDKIIQSVLVSKIKE